MTVALCQVEIKTCQPSIFALIAGSYKEGTPLTKGKSSIGQSMSININIKKVI